MPRPDKVAIVNATREAAEKASSIVMADFKGLNVEEITDLRRKFREQSIDYRVVKNTLARISLESLGYTELLDYLKGPTGFAFGYDDPGTPVRVILDFNKKTEKPRIKAIWFDGQLFSGEDAKKIAELPSKDQLIANFVSGLNAPISNFVRGLNNILQNFVGTLAAIQREKENN